MSSDKIPRNEAARREAGDWQTMKCTPDKPDAVHYTTHPDAPPPPADELVARLRKMGFWKAEPNQVDKWVPDAVPLEAAAAIEALRAREKALEGALREIKSIHDHHFPILGAECSAGREMGEIATKALAVGGADV